MSSDQPSSDQQSSDRPIALIAPSWGPTCIFETCGPALIEVLLGAGFTVIARPHPMTATRTPKAIDALRAFLGRANFELELDVASQDSLHRSDLMISDWSGAALEYAFGLERPVLFVDVPRKVNNPDYEQLGIEPFEASVRERIGRVVDPARLDEVPAAVEALVSEAAGYHEQIREVRAQNVHNLGTSGRVAAEFIASKADAYLGRQS